MFGTAADHFLAVMFCVDEKDQEFDELAWHKANPLLDVNPHLLAAIRKEAVEAKHMPSKMAEFRIKRLNRPSSTSDGWIDLTKWQRCNKPVSLEAMKGYPCWGGLDLASTTDMAALRLVWLVDGVFYTHGIRWVPEQAVAQRTERATVPYASWVEAKLIKQTPGDVTDYAIVEADILEAWETFQPRAIGYDTWNATDLANRLIEAGVPMLQFIQGPKSYHPAMQALEIAYIGGKLAHGGDPVLNWCASNVVAHRDRNLNMAPDKKRSADKIDDISAFLMAIGVSLGPIESDTLEQGFVVIN
jgi:phage terminase large subunit-like protein